ncbi:hypothetical protein NQ317_018631 [Molorchus minor]|uniref:Uncharacterized protein n=1 Tax=Molorchus minor TaxID=1323400 RepID=A0ABQ9J4R8_9CUCU|nr:hypothetical protein NQ317_018631 [Molorchus minor]
MESSCKNLVLLAETRDSLDQRRLWRWIVWGFIFVGDAGNARIQVFQPNGTLVKIFGRSRRNSKSKLLLTEAQTKLVVKPE